MSSIQSVQSSDIRQLLRQQSISHGNVNQSSQSRQDPLNSVLESSGLSDEDQTSLKSDLKSALDQVFSSGSFPPDPQQVQSAVKDVFSKYGLDADQLASKLTPSGDSGGIPSGGFPGAGFPGGGMPPGIGGPPPSSGSSDDSSSSDTSSDSTDTTQTLLDALKVFVSKLSVKNSTQDTTDYLISGLVGFNAQA